MKSLVHLIANLFFVFIGLSVVFVILLFFLNKKAIKNGLFNCFTSIWIATTLIFVPMMVISWENITSKLIISSGSLMKMLIDNVVNGLIFSLFLPALIVFVVASIGIVLSLVFMLKGKKEDVTLYDETTEPEEIAE